MGTDNWTVLVSQGCQNNRPHAGGWLKVLTFTFLQFCRLEVQWVKVLVTKLCPTLLTPMDCSLPGSSVHGIFQARILEWVAISFSRGSYWPRVWTQVSCIAGRFFTIWATREAPRSPRSDSLLCLSLLEPMASRFSHSASNRAGKYSFKWLFKLQWPRPHNLLLASPVSDPVSRLTSHIYLYSLLLAYCLVSDLPGSSLILLMPVSWKNVLMADYLVFSRFSLPLPLWFSQFQTLVPF